MLNVRLNELLEKRGKTLYWLANEVEVHYNTLWRIQQGKADGIRFNLLENICKALECSPGDLLVIEDGKPESKKRAKSKD